MGERRECDGQLLTNMLLLSLLYHTQTQDFLQQFEKFICFSFSPLPLCKCWTSFVWAVGRRNEAVSG